MEIARFWLLHFFDWKCSTPLLHIPGGRNWLGFSYSGVRTLICPLFESVEIEQLRNHELGCTSKRAFCPPSSSPRYHLRKRSRLCSDRARTTSALRPWHRLLPLLDSRSFGRSLRHGSAFRVGIRGSERYRTLLRLLGPHTSPLSRAFESRWTERPRAPEGTAGSPFSREQETP